jgi:hypothetical protein
VTEPSLTAFVCINRLIQVAELQRREVSNCERLWKDTRSTILHKAAISAAFHHTACDLGWMPEMTVEHRDVKTVVGGTCKNKDRRFSPKKSNLRFIRFSCHVANEKSNRHHSQIRCRRWSVLQETSLLSRAETKISYRRLKSCWHNRR